MLLALALVCLALLGHGEGAAKNGPGEVNGLPRGVHPNDIYYYSSDYSNMFNCFDGSGEFTMDVVNDNYCDCEDGSDEPGTPACSNMKFWCQNKRHVGKYIPTSWVNDGVCDCCDGTDEYSGAVDCKTTCRALGDQAEKAARSARDAARKGFSVRKNWVAKAKKERVAKKKELSELKAERETLEAERDALKAVKEEKDELEREAKAVHEQWWRDELQRRKDEKAAVEGTVEPAAGESEEEELVVEETDDYGLEAEVGDGAIEVEEDIHHEEEEEEEEMPPYPAETDALIAEATLARSEYNDADRKFRDVREKQEELEKSLELDFGPDDALFGMQDECFSYDTAEYTYELCPFQRCTQKPKDGGSPVQLGKWGSWEEGSDYARMEYRDGMRCWGGPDRSIVVSLECGVENTVLSVDEPNKCEYAMRFATPAACPHPDKMIEEERSRKDREEEDAYKRFREEL